MYSTCIFILNEHDNDDDIRFSFISSANRLYSSVILETDYADMFIGSDFPVNAPEAKVSWCVVPRIMVA